MDGIIRLVLLLGLLFPRIQSNVYFDITTFTVDGKWSDWEKWSACTTTCDSSTQTRSRTCTNPQPSNKGTDCEGSSEESKSCMLESCPVPVGWRTWGEWGSCSTTCGVGIQNRNRSCVVPRSNRIGDYCAGDSTDHQLCMPRLCADGDWATWSSWNTCSVTCGGGFYQRTRDCTYPPPPLFGRMCTGPSSEIASCNTQHCPKIDGGWTDWSIWSGCSVSCGGGFYKRYRDCTNPTPSPFGRQCAGSYIDVAVCSTQPCPHTAGGWSEWTQWGSCTAKSGYGMRMRNRQCNNPTPSACGMFCHGASVDTEVCYGSVGPTARRKDGDRLEIFVAGQWGTVCDDGFDTVAAKVACRMATHESYRKLDTYPYAEVTNPPAGPSDMPIWLDDVKCTGNENSLLECIHQPIGTHNCNHDEDVGISCGDLWNYILRG
ncbi:coadhesin-like isoform X3 [Dreissena polymorpha]|uniref:coadhesin-like isoform X3 n=1 Tax=Dreissena polymorpha TaxID=45954 RepID=UPI002264D214|nr:coadhesin-like isoform X3 [Dreissena polymorpha]